MDENFENEERLDDDEYDPEIDEDDEEDGESFYSKFFDENDYEDQAKTAAFMEKYIDESERIIWSQSMYPGATGQESHMGCRTAFIAALIVEPIVFIWFVPPLGIASILLGIVLLILKKSKKYRYALTDRRILMREGRKLISIPLEDIVADDFLRQIRVRICDYSERRVGSVYIAKKLVVRKSGVKIPKYAYIRGIKNPGYAASVIRREVNAVKGLDYS